ncbi:PLP-dependent aminotransferase family protein [Nonomuraea basaltis]|uniref:aminotransferase-like domain-containing protein n=1 Tax=Nonomuraea basaltis TaxID=2495887 RepID=UPI00110C648D|nr:PLP-dependent aminotransferase family protein [Nonomuraea basaltis]TMR97198.1 PLP-dependent aminotransferase family protein [Nonomuraea basaltis]
MDDYQRLADAVEADIRAGKLLEGDRLLPQRNFARRHRIATSTAARVYQELIRRGLVVGEVGRGTFVRAGRTPPEPALAEPATAWVDLELNFPTLPGQSTMLARAFNDLPANALGAVVGASGTTPARRAAAALLTRPGWAPQPSQVLFTGNGRQAIAAAVSALVPVGHRLGVETLTYPVVKGIAARLGITLVPLPMDAEGLIPSALRKMHRASPLSALYLQPTLHNPLGTTMSAERRADLASVLQQLDLPAIEDTVYAFLRDDPAPLAAHHPANTIVVDSLSKRLTPGLTLGFAVVPPVLLERLSTAIRSGAWTCSRFALEVGTRWMTDGTAEHIENAKRQDAADRQVLVRERLGGFTVQADPRAYHCWWELPEPWRAETFVAAAARRGIAVTPAAAFAIGSGRAPNAVRLAISSPSHQELATALDLLATLARRTPEDASVD